MMCEMCGKDENLFQTNIEGSMLNVCQSCSRHGKVVKRIIIPRFAPKKQVQEEPQRARKPHLKEKTLAVIEDFAIQVKNAREKLGLKQKDLAQNMAEKESVIHHIESGKLEPSIKLARKFEKILNIRLIEEVEEGDTALRSNTPGEVTIGDMINIKKRK